MATLTALTLVVIVLGALILTASGIWWFTPLASNWNDIDSALLITLAVIGIAFVVLNIVLAYFVLALSAPRAEPRPVSPRQPQA
jgi:cytochrome c oxidase subunit 2